MNLGRANPLSGLMEDRNGWPRTVNTFADMQNFVQMMSGCPKELQTDLSGHLLSLCPSVENRQMASRCFLVLVRGRTSDLDLAKDVAACQQHWRAANTSPYAINTGRHKNWYYTVQQSKGGCICHVDFGSQGKFTQDCVSSSKSAPGRALEDKFGNAMKSNVQAMQLDHPSSSVWWLQGYWHMLLNRYEFDKNQGIDWHVDDKDPRHETTYLSEHDPISSYSAGVPWPLCIRSRSATTQGRKTAAILVGLVHQQDGDVLFMGGDFQIYFEHAVPTPLELWSMNGGVIRFDSDSPNRSNSVQWVYPDLPTFERDLDRYRKGRAQGQPTNWVRFNVTVRWHRKHKHGCPHSGESRRNIQEKLIRYTVAPAVPVQFPSRSCPPTAAPGQPLPFQPLEGPVTLAPKPMVFEVPVAAVPPGQPIHPPVSGPIPVQARPPVYVEPPVRPHAQPPARSTLGPSQPSLGSDVPWHQHPQLPARPAPPRREARGGFHRSSTEAAQEHRSPDTPGKPGHRPPGHGVPGDGGLSDGDAMLDEPTPAHSCALLRLECAAGSSNLAAVVSQR